MKTVVPYLCALSILSCALVSCGGADAQIAHPRVLVGGQNTNVLHGNYIWKSHGFSVSDHLPFVEAGQMYFDGAGHHWGSSTMNVDGAATYRIGVAEHTTSMIALKAPLRPRRSTETRAASK